VCAQTTRETPDLIDEMAAKVLDTGGRVEHVYADTRLAEHVVAALLRFPVPRPFATWTTRSRDVSLTARREHRIDHGGQGLQRKELYHAYAIRSVP
jgi:hypothetical protein